MSEGETSTMEINGFTPEQQTENNIKDSIPQKHLPDECGDANEINCST